MAIFHSSVELPEVDVLLHGCAEHPPSIDVLQQATFCCQRATWCNYMYTMYIYCVDHQGIQWCSSIRIFCCCQTCKLMTFLIMLRRKQKKHTSYICSTESVQQGGSIHLHVIGYHIFSMDRIMLGYPLHFQTKPLGSWHSNLLQGTIWAISRLRGTQWLKLMHSWKAALGCIQTNLKTGTHVYVSILCIYIYIYIYITYIYIYI